ncbi:hypothetical protein LX32DRAFT_341440 [Colletotrichum zoysiae]|uniref:Uncharacterized protein n=1 Tax=Colletotrichum zoysiae TaxID=1216348 RepID=A0AAD9HKS0_9PEZI|nr:hypothetical protein LX32DRAFT_341440 [Colletotrichum zoysiae]
MLSCAACLSVRGVGPAFLCFPKNTHNTLTAPNPECFGAGNQSTRHACPGKQNQGGKAGQIPTRLPLCMAGDLPAAHSLPITRLQMRPELHCCLSLLCSALFIPIKRRRVQTYGPVVPVPYVLPLLRYLRSMHGWPPQAPSFPSFAPCPERQTPLSVQPYDTVTTTNNGQLS